MHIISKKALRDFWQANKESEDALARWYSIAKRAAWNNLPELKIDFPQADLVGKCVVFNIGGNKYRLITKIEFLKQQVYVKFVLTHKEYDKNTWKESC